MNFFRKCVCAFLFPWYIALRCIFFLPHLLRKLYFQRIIRKEFYSKDSFLLKSKLKERKIKRKIVLIDNLMSPFCVDKRFNELSHVIGRAFFNDPLTKVFYTKTEKALTRNRDFFGSEMKTNYCVIYSIADEEGPAKGALCGGCCWKIKKSYSVYDLLKGLFIMLKTDISWKNFKLFAEVEKKGNDIMKDQNQFLYLSIIGVDPHATNKGYGTDLLKPMLDYADEKQFSCFLESSNLKNVSFYERNGFKAKETVDIGGVIFTLMRRDPKKEKKQ